MCSRTEQTIICLPFQLYQHDTDPSFSRVIRKASPYDTTKRGVGICVDMDGVMREHAQTKYVFLPSGWTDSSVDRLIMAHPQDSKTSFRIISFDPSFCNGVYLSQNEQTLSQRPPSRRRSRCYPFVHCRSRCPGLPGARCVHILHWSHKKHCRRSRLGQAHKHTLERVCIRVDSLRRHRRRSLILRRCNTTSTARTARPGGMPTGVERRHWLDSRGVGCLICNRLGLAV